MLDCVEEEVQVERERAAAAAVGQKWMCRSQVAQSDRVDFCEKPGDERDGRRSHRRCSERV
jgi:hypothetical protein